jgi:predicted O-linked N-acetylglucosamine transferase (SPINDLY family)
VTQTTGQLILRLAERTDLDVTLIAIQSQDVPVAIPIEEHGGKLARITEQVLFPQIRAQVAALCLDVLVYTDIGMNPVTTFLGYTRLARVQCALGGHPDTTGIPNMDYFLSQAIMEPPQAQEHYTETLIPLEHGGLIFERPVWAASGKCREDFGLPTDDRLYFCPMMLQKIHPDFDDIAKGILARDPKARIIFPRSEMWSGRWTELLEQRFDAVFPPGQRNRIGFVPWQNSTGDFVALLQCMDAVLDSVHFGAGSTTLVAIAAGVPIVTVPGEFLRGRVVAGYYKLLGTTDTVATSTADYVEKAVRLANDAAWRKELGDQMRERGSVLFDKDNNDAVNEFAEVIRSLWEKS